MKRRLQARDAQAQQTTGARHAAPESPYLTSKEAIHYLRLDTLRSPFSALYRLINEHKLPHGRRGGLFLFDKRELDAWIRDSGMHEPAIVVTRRLKAITR